MRKTITYFLISLVSMMELMILVLLVIYAGRIRTIASIERVTSYDDGYNLYLMDVKYNYDLDAIIDYGIVDSEHGKACYSNNACNPYGFRQGYIY